jgi:hypothetical protein
MMNRAASLWLSLLRTGGPTHDGQPLSQLHCLMASKVFSKISSHFSKRTSENPIPLG